MAKGTTFIFLFSSLLVLSLSSVSADKDDHGDQQVLQ